MPAEKNLVIESMFEKEAPAGDDTEQLLIDATPAQTPEYSPQAAISQGSLPQTPN
jgi:hypothetical protein